MQETELSHLDPDKLKKYCQLDGEGDQIRTTTFRHRHLQPASCRLAAIFPVCAHTFHYRDGNNASINIYTAISSLHTRSTFTHGKNECILKKWLALSPSENGQSSALILSF
jgi:hypothetical protein